MVAKRILNFGSESSAKQAALYYEYVVPFCHSSRPGSFRQLEAGIRNTEFPSDILPPELLPISSLCGNVTLRQIRDAGQAIEVADHYLYHLTHTLKSGNAERELTRNEVGMFIESVQRYQSFGKGAGFGLILPQEVRAALQTDETDVLALVTSEVHLVDGNKISWEHVLEFRRDKASKRKLQQFRALFEGPYAGKPASQIQVDIEKKLHAYDTAVKSWGFETRASTVEKFTNQAAIINFLSLAIGASVGELKAAILAGGSGLILNIANLAVHVARRKHGLSQLAEQSDIEYVIDVRREFGEKPNSS